MRARAAFSASYSGRGWKESDRRAALAGVHSSPVRRICVHSGGQFRFSLPGDTPDEQVSKFIQVYALGIVDGQSARATTVEGHIQGRLNLAARRLGQAIGKLKAGSQ